jgi:F-type H+-transporting ATPase subunit gamma
MPSLRDLRRRIKSVEGIRQITRAMQMVSATKLRRSQQRIEAARPYTEKMDEILSHLSRSMMAGSANHPLMEPRERVRKLFILGVASDKGLCGSFNSNAIRRTEKRAQEARSKGIEEVEIFPIGRKMHDYFRRRGWKIRPQAESFRQIDQQLPVSVLQDMTDLVASLFLNGEIDQADMVYTEFRNAVSHKLVVRQFLPVVGLRPSEDNEPEAHVTRDYIFEPDPEQLFSSLIPKYARMMVFRMLADSLASEHAARMNAMRNATDNAAEMIDTLTLYRNKARQAAITKELSEIVGGAEAFMG